MSISQYLCGGDDDGYNAEEDFGIIMMMTMIITKVGTNCTRYS